MAKAVPTVASIAAPGVTVGDRVRGVLTCAALGPVCIAGMVTGSAVATGTAVGVEAREARDEALTGLGDTVTGAIAGVAAPVAEISSAVRWSVIAVVSLVFLAMAVLITFILFRIGVL